MGAYVRALTLPDLQGRERRDGVPERRRVHLGAESADDAVRLEAVETGLDRPAGDTEPPGRLQHPDPRLLGQQHEKPAVQLIDPHGGLSVVVILYR